MPNLVSNSRLQQQTPRSQNRQQQQSSGSHEFQPSQAQKGGGDGASQMGEGSYEGTRDYQKRMKSYLKTADVKSDADAAQPATPDEARELLDAEKQGLSHSKAPGK